MDYELDSKTAEQNINFSQGVLFTLKKQYLPCFLTDATLVGIVAVMFRNPGAPDSALAKQIVISSILPLCYCLLLLVALLQSMTYQYSVLTRVLRWNILRLLGECSLTIYIFHAMVVDFYYDNLINCIREKYAGNIYGRKFDHHQYGETFRRPEYLWFAFVLAIAVGVFMQKVIVDRLLIKLQKAIIDCFSHKQIQSER